ncbi:MAG TPA: hypothetical protein VK421_01780 [Pyrinomonadaceae bacterium]|nr:hypothetical protein [Pyrinomonadaceae bacterium]
MKVCSVSISARPLLRAALCASALASSAAPALSQRGVSRDSTLRTRNADTVRELEIRRREGMVREAKPQPQPHPVLPYARGKEDFRSLQLVNNEVMRAVFGAGSASPPDYGRIAAAAAEINKRASRLKSNLRLPEPYHESPHPRPTDTSSDEQLRASLRVLDGLIMRFVTNPAFQSPSTVDTRLMVNAAEHLTQIVELSRVVRLGAEKMRKARKAEAVGRKG